MQHHNPEKAENELIEALRIDPKNIWALILMGNLLSKENKDVASAKKYYDDVLKYYPDNNIALNNIAATLLQIDKTQESIPYFEKAIQADPKYLISYYGLAMAYMNMKELDKAFDTTLKGLLLGRERVGTQECTWNSKDNFLLRLTTLSQRLITIRLFLVSRKILRIIVADLSS